IDLTWVTEITHIRPSRYFVDEQRIGPYTLWHHEHWFDVVPGGVNMRDILHYAVPFGWLGGWADRFFIASQIEDIFAYRNTAILKGVDEGWFE
ncbi:MAG: SRPBCC family protein, partial [Saprospiraceae bacterium]|nr:SRPBCC family protein [Saprospiraceae bacterium]